MYICICVCVRARAWMLDGCLGGGRGEGGGESGGGAGGQVRERGRCTLYVGTDYGYDTIREVSLTLLTQDGEHGVSKYLGTMGCGTTQYGFVLYGVGLVWDLGLGLGLGLDLD